MKYHPLDPISLAFGGLFTALGTFLAVSDTPWETLDGRWIWPAVLIVVGGAILASTMRQLRPAQEEIERDEGPSDPDLSGVSEMPQIPNLPDVPSA